MKIPIAQYVKIKRRNHKNKIYYKWSFVWDNEMLKTLEVLRENNAN